MHLPHTTKYTIEKQNVHISFLNDIFWDIERGRDRGNVERDNAITRNKDNREHKDEPQEEMTWRKIMSGKRDDKDNHSRTNRRMEATDNGRHGGSYREFRRGDICCDGRWNPVHSIQMSPGFHYPLFYLDDDSTLVAQWTGVNGSLLDADWPTPDQVNSDFPKKDHPIFGLILSKDRRMPCLSPD